MRAINFYLRSLVVFAMIMVNNLQAQNSTGGTPPAPQLISFQKTYGSGEARKSILVDSSVFTLGKRSNQVYLQKNDLSGNVIWAKKYTINGIGNDFKRDSNGNFILIGTVNPGTPGSAIFVMKVDSNGYILQQPATFSSNQGTNPAMFGNGIEIVPDGYLITGRSSGPASVYLGLIVIKIDFELNLVWSYVYGDETYGVSIIKTNDGCYVISGAFGNSTNSYDVCLLKIDNLGNQIWFKYYGGTDMENSFDLKQMSDNSIVTVGFTQSNANGGRDVFVLKVLLDNGNVVWAKNIGSGNKEKAASVIETTNGYLISGCSYDPIQFGTSSFLAKIQTDGSFLWSKIIGSPISPSDCYLNSLAQTDKGLFMTGMRSNMFYVVKADSNFDPGCDVANVTMTAVPATLITGSITLSKNMAIPVVANPLTTVSNSSLLLATVCFVVDSTTLVIDTTEQVDTTHTNVSFLEKKQIRIYPNPAIDNITIIGAENSTLFIYDSFGRILLQKEINQSETKVLFNLPKGVYIYTLNTAKNKVSNRLVVLK